MTQDMEPNMLPMYVCMYLCMYVCMYVCVYDCMYTVCMYVCVYVGMQMSHIDIAYHIWSSMYVQTATMNNNTWRNTLLHSWRLPSILVRCAKCWRWCRAHVKAILNMYFFLGHATSAGRSISWTARGTSMLLVKRCTDMWKQYCLFGKEPQYWFAAFVIALYSVV